MCIKIFFKAANTQPANPCNNKLIWSGLSSMIPCFDVPFCTHIWTSGRQWVDRTSTSTARSGRSRYVNHKHRCAMLCTSFDCLAAVSIPWVTYRAFSNLVSKTFCAFSLAMPHTSLSRRASERNVLNLALRRKQTR